MACRHLTSSALSLGIQRGATAVGRTADAPVVRSNRVADGSKGPRVYDWAAGQYGVPTEKGLLQWLLIRRSIDKPDEYAYYLCAALPETPPEVTAHDLAVAASQRGSIECCFESAKQETGLDDYEVRSWHGWYRHVTLSMLALALLAVIRAHAVKPTPNQKKAKLIWSR